MNDACKSTFDEGVATIGGQVGYKGDGPFAMYENLKSTSQDVNSEDVVIDQGTGIELNAPQEEEVVHHPPDGGKGWLVVLAAAFLLSFLSMQTALHPQTLTFIGRNPQPHKQIQGTTESAPEFQGSSTGSMTPEQRLDHLIETMLKTGNQSLAAEIALILYTLNRTQEFETLFQQKQQELSAEAMAPADATMSPPVDVSATIDTGSVSNVQKIFFSLFGFVSATLILVIGYRWVSAVGGVVMGLGCLGAAYCDNTNIHLVNFLYGALPGIGHNMITVSSTVAVLEYFKKRRLVALLVPSLIKEIASLIMQVLLIFVFLIFGINSWKSYLLLQTGIAGVAVLLSLALKPLKLRVKDEGNGSLMSKIFGIDGLNIYRRPSLYSFAFVWFLWEGGYSIILAKLPSLKLFNLIPAISFGKILVMILGVGILIGSCIPCCIPRSISLRTAVILLIVQFVAVCIFNLVASQLNYNFIYALVFSVIMGIFKGMSSPVLQYSIPLIVGEENLTIGTGVMLTGQGLGGLAMTVAADEIQKITQDVEGCFYLAGALFLVGSGISVLSYLLSRETNKIENSAK